MRRFKNVFLKATKYLEIPFYLILQILFWKILWFRFFQVRVKQTKILRKITLRYDMQFKFFRKILFEWFVFFNLSLLRNIFHFTKGKRNENRKMLIFLYILWALLDLAIPAVHLCICCFNFVQNSEEVFYCLREWKDVYFICWYILLLKSTLLKRYQVDICFSLLVSFSSAL